MIEPWRVEMYRWIIGFTAAMLLSVFPAAATDWKAIAINEYGLGYGAAADEHEAKQAAIEDCEEATARTCEWEHAASVPESWDIAAVACRNGVVNVAGSQYGVEQAAQLAADEFGGRRCRIVAESAGEWEEEFSEINAD